MNWTDQGAKVYCSSSLSGAVFYTTPTPAEHPRMQAVRVSRGTGGLLHFVQLNFDLHRNCTCDALIKYIIEDV